MMKKFGVVLFILGFVLSVWYILPSSPEFPLPPDDSVQSMEKADTETSLRRAYFTNYTREEVVRHYEKQLGGKLLIRLNYPPEEAQTLIRDQTRSWYLEELVNPLRESIFINGFIAQVAKDDIWYKGKHYEQKITIRYVPTSFAARLAVMTLILLSIGILGVELSLETKSVKK